MDEHAGPGAARLTGVGHDVGDPDVDRLGQVGGREDDVGGLAAEFEGDLLDLPGGDRGDLPADGGGAGEGDQVDAGVFGEGLAGDRAEAGDQVEDARREAGLVHRFGEETGDQRGVLGGLHDDRAARREGRGDLGDDLVQGVVPGRDRGHDTDRLVVHDRVAGLLLEGVLPRQLGVGARDRDRHARVDGLRELQGRAEFGRDRLGDLVRAGHEHVPEGGQARRTLGGRGRGPVAEGGAGGPYGGVDVLGGARRDRADDLLVDRVHDLDHVLADGGAPGAPDVHAVVCLHRASSGGGASSSGT